MNVCAIIPARYASTRFPGKPLADIAGKPMIRHVYERVEKAGTVDRVIVATDDERIMTAVAAFGGEAVMTRPDHPSGTDRLAEVAAGIETDLVVNVQGDEPLIAPLMIEQAVQPLLDDPAIVMGTLKCRVWTEPEYLDPNIVKVVTDESGFALYFSRSPLPFLRDADFASARIYRHVGLYVYRRDFLLRYPGLPETDLEKAEKLEQLRALQHGFRIFVAETECRSIGVDVPADLERVVSELAK